MITHARRLVLAALISAAVDGGAVSPAGAGTPAGRDPAPRSAAHDSITAFKALVAASQFDQAETRVRAYIGALQAASGTDSLEVALVIDWLVDYLTQNGNVDQSDARVLAERSIRIYETALGPDAPEVAASLHALGMVFWGLGDLQSGLAAMERSVAIRETALGPDDPILARTLNSKGNFLLSLTKYAEARACYERALHIWEKVEGVGSANAASPLHDLAIIDDTVGDWTAARPLYERVLSTVEKTRGPNAPMLAKVLGNYAGMLLDAGDFETARPLFERSLRIVESQPRPNPNAISWALNNLAGALVAMGDTAAARPLYERALTIEEKSLASNPGGWNAELLSSYADLLRLTGDYQGAKEKYEQALAIDQKIYREDPLGLVWILDRMAVLLCNSGDYAGARAYSQQAVSLTERAFGADSPQLVPMLGTLALALANLGESRAAVDSSLRAEAIGRAHLSLTVRTLPERQAMRYAAARGGGMGLAFSLALGPLAGDSTVCMQVCNALIRSRALVLDEMAARHLVLGSMAETMRFAEAFTAARQRLANLWVRGPKDSSPEEYQALLDDARKEDEAAEQALAEGSAAFRQERHRSQMGLADVSAALGREDALIGFVRFDHLQPHPQPESVRGAGSRSIAWYGALVIQSRGRTPSLVSVGRAAEIDSLIVRWGEEVQSGAAATVRGSRPDERSYRAAAEALRRRIWDPLVRYCGDAHRVFIVPDGALNLVSFAALPVGESEYLVERGPLLHYLSAERDLVTPAEAAPADGGLLALGGADFDTSPAASDDTLTPAGAAPSLAALRGPRSACGDFRSLHFAPLEATTREVEEIAALWKKHGSPGMAVTLVGTRATKRAFTGAAPGHRVLHLATHGFFLGHCPSALPGGRGIGGVRPAEEGPVRGENPLLLSGLALAGANRREAAGSNADDGILTAEEITTLDLAAVEWAVLSACETGVGKVVSGEGVFGLRRAFQVAGARTLIMSLWGVEDEAARAWMRSLYEARLGRRLTTAEAVRAGTLAVLERRRARGESVHPFFWAGFIATGSWR